MRKSRPTIQRRLSARWKQQKRLVQTTPYAHLEDASALPPQPTQGASNVAGPASPPLPSWSEVIVPLQPQPQLGSAPSPAEDTSPVQGRELPVRPTLWALPAARPPKIDGVVESAEWSAAPPVSVFTQKAPLDGSAPTDKTVMRLLSDDRAVYLAFECEQKHSPVVARLARRDRPTESDSVTVAFDSRADGRSAYEFTVTAAGVLVDGIRYEDGKIAREWDGVWEAKVQVARDRWSAELRIPLHVLRANAADSGLWKFQSRRYLSSRQETNEWAYIPRYTGGEVSHYGHIEGLRKVQRGGAFELTPFVLGRVRHQSVDPNLVHKGWSFAPSGGVDFKWHFAKSGALAGTINPDFGQVEADRLILNLTTVELVFPEKRPFFLSGMDDFTTMAPIFYSRRIGRVPRVPRISRDPTQPERLYDAPLPAPIYGALKLSTDLTDSLTLATLTAVTGPSDFEVVSGDGARSGRLLEPLTSYSVLRLSSRWTPALTVGATATATVRAEPDSLLPSGLTSHAQYTPVSSGASGLLPQQRCPQGEITALGQRCFHDAYVGSLDVTWRSPGGDYAIRGQGYGSALLRGPARSLPDGTRLRSGDMDGGGVLRVSKQGGEHWLWDGSISAHGRRLDFNDLGYMERQNYVRAGAYVEYRTLTAWHALLETHTSLLAYGLSNLSGLTLGRGLMLMENIVLQSRWSFTLGVHGALPRFDDREVGDGTALERAGLVGAVQAVSSDPRRTFFASAQLTQERLQNGLNLDAQLMLTWLPVSRAELSLLTAYTVNRGEPRFVGSQEDSSAPLFGRLHAESASVTLRAAITFIPTVTLQSYAQAFLAIGRYEDFSEAPAASLATRRVRLQELTSAAMPSLRPDFQQGSLAVNVVLRWEYRLGSTLYLAYVRAQNAMPALGPVESPRLTPGFVRSAPASDTFMLKLAYWLG